MNIENAKEMVTGRLDGLGIAYTAVCHEPITTMEEGEAIAARLGVAACKNLLLVNRQGRRFLLSLSGEKRLRAKDVAWQAGSSHLSFATADDLLTLLRTPQGALSPLSLMFDTGNRVRLLIDKDVAGREWIGCHPCANTCSLRLRTKDLLGAFLPAVGHGDYAVIEI